MKYTDGINVLKPAIFDNTVKIDFTVPNKIEKFFKDQSFYAEYVGNINIKNIKDSILVIPLLSNILPVAWFSCVDIFVEEIDETFYNIIPNIQAGLKSLYPNVKMGGKLIAKKIIKNEMIKLGKSAQLFSGGIDSLATYIRRIGEKPNLVTIWGADVNINDTDSWEKVKNYNNKIADKLETQIFFIKSNFTLILNTRALGEEYGHLINGFHWWAGVQHGLGFAGLCSPITYAKEISTFYIPASDTAEFNNPWGSHPLIDNEIKWANTEVVHESYDLSRQGKVNLISRFIKENKNDLQIRVCWQADHNGGNCNKCEKCCRTIVGLLVEGIDPNLHGFNVTENFFSFAKEKIIKGFWSYYNSDTMPYWQDIQKSIPQNLQMIDERYRGFLCWLKKYNFIKHGKPSFLTKVKKNSGRFLPTFAKKFIKWLIYIGFVRVLFTGFLDNNLYFI
jgi:hypothetical protein